MRPPDPGAHPHRVANVRQRRGLEVIALFKLFKGTLSLLLAAGALGLLRDSWESALEDWMTRLALHETHHYLAAFADRALDFLNSGEHRFVAVALAALLYAVIFFTEGIALWKERRWAEYLTIVTTALPLPLELRALAHRVSPVSLGALALNLAVIAYLVWQLAVTREHHLPAAAPAQTPPPGGQGAR